MDKETEIKKLKEVFEEELDDHFQDRAHHAPNHSSDNSKHKVKHEREDFNLDLDVAGCCFSGCLTCPWGFGANQ